MIWDWFALPMMWSFLITFGFMMVVSMLPFVLTGVNFLGWGLLAPTSWLVSLSSFIYFRKRLSVIAPSVSPTQVFTRRQKRRFAKMMRNHMRGMKNGFIEEKRKVHGLDQGFVQGQRRVTRSSEGFHRTYPLRLRSNNNYHRRSPYVFNAIRTHNAVNDFVNRLPPQRPLNRKLAPPRNVNRSVTFAPDTNFDASANHFGGKDKIMYPQPKHAAPETYRDDCSFWSINDINKYLSMSPKSKLAWNKIKREVKMFRPH